MNLRQLIKKDALEAVKSNWTAAVFMVFFFLVINMVFFSLLLVGESLTEPNLSYGIVQRIMRLLSSRRFGAYLYFAIAIFLLRLVGIAPMILSKSKWYYNITRGKVSHIHILFRNYKSKESFWKATKLYLLYMGIRLLLFVVCYLPATTCVIFGFRTFLLAESNTSSGLGIAILLLGIVLLVLGMVFFAYFSAKFFLVPYLYAQSDSLPLGQYLKRSSIYMKGREGEFLSCLISFIPAFLSCTFILPIFVVFPHFEATLAIYARFYIEQNEMQKPTVYKPMFQ